MAQVWANVHLKGSAPEIINFIEIVKAICVLVLNRCLGRPQLCHDCDRGSMEESAVFANVKKNKAIAVQRSPFHENFINIVPNSVV
jgi:hypothetical protein